VDVVEREQDRPFGGQVLERGPDRLVAPVSLHLQRALEPSRRAGQRWQQCRELGQAVGVDRPQRRRFEPPEHVVERIDDQPERHVLLQLAAASGDHREALRLGAHSQLRQQPGLADAGLADERDRGASAGAGRVEHLADHPKLRLTAYESASGRPADGPPHGAILSQCHRDSYVDSRMVPGRDQGHDPDSRWAGDFEWAGRRRRRCNGPSASSRHRRTAWRTSSSATSPR
jgi:hypothetical protein